MSEDKFKTIFDNAVEGILIADVSDKRFTCANKAMCAMLGYSEVELLGMGVVDIHPRGDSAGAISVFESMARGEISLGENIPCLRKDGSVFYADIKAGSMECDGKMCNVGFFTDVTPRKMMEAELRESVERLGLIVKGGDLGTWDWDIITGKVINNERWAEMIGYNLGELKESVENWDILTHPDDIPRVRKALDDHLQGRTPFYEIEHRMRHKSGEWIWVLDKGQVFKRDKHGKPLRMVGTHLEISDRKRMEKELRESEHRYKMIARMTTDYFFKLEVDEHGKIAMTFATDGMKDATGRTIDEVRAMDSWLKIISPEDHEKAMNILQTVLTEGQRADMECRTILKDGNTRWVWVAASPEWDEDKHCVKTIWGSVRDITAAKEAEEIKRESAAVRESQAVLLTAFENAKDAIFWVDAETGNIVNCNLSAEKMLERGRSEIIGKHHTLLHPQKDEQNYSERFNKRVRARDAGDSEVDIITKSGRIIPASISATILSIGGRLVNQGIIRDLTDIKKAQTEKEALIQQLNQSQKMEAIGRLAGGIAHDFNNIMAIILGTAQLGQKKIQQGDIIADSLQKIIKTAHRAIGITTKLLAFARREQLEVRNVAANDLVKELAEMLNGSMPKNINIDTSLDAEAPCLSVDPNQIQQALLNLCINACDAMPDGGTLSLKTSAINIDGEPCSPYQELAPGDYCLIEVSDSGTGVPLGILDRIFEPFFTTKERGKGTGLGLSVALGIIKGHGGCIEIENSPLQGTIARVYLPATEHGLESRGPEAAATQSVHAARTLLIVDDESDFLDMLCDTLSSTGHTVYIASRGADAVDIYREKQSEIDAALLDIIMPGMDGAEVFRALKRLNPAVKAIFCSGYSADGTSAELLAEGAAGFIQKPFFAEDLLNMIDDVCGGRKQ